MLPFSESMPYSLLQTSFSMAATMPVMMAMVMP